ncbi:MAG: VanW family protein [Candidatus Shapirobacteria bacterium]
MKKISTFFLIIGLLGIVFVSPLIFAFGKSGRETTILGKNYSTLNKKEIVEKLNKDFNFDNSIKLVSDDRTFEIKISSISAKINNEEMVSNLLYRRLNQGISNYISAYFGKKDFELEVDWDKNQLGEQIVGIAEQIDKPFIPTEIVNDKGRVKIVNGEIGAEVDKNQLAMQIISLLKTYSVDSNTQIPINKVGLLPTEDEKQKALDIASKALIKEMILNWESGSEIVQPETVISWIGFGNSCKTEKLDQYVSNFNKSIKQDPRDAKFQFENGKVLQFESSKDGYIVDEKKMVDDICQNLSMWMTNEDTQIKYELPLIKTQAKIKTNEVNDLGIKELIGRGTSSFRHSSDIRNFNVQKGSEIINRILVAPGETFSFIKNLGEVSLDNGFKQAYVINKGKTVLDVGGGICQVSTTLYRAMLDAGLNITDRKGHAYRVSYYEEDSKPGFDATVFIPNPDLKFVNDTGSYILIQSFYDGIKKTLAYEIYGTKDGRKVEISNYKQWDATPAPPDVWVDDPTLAPGKVVKDESRVPGLKTSFDWKVTKDGEILHQKTYVTNYTPWAAVYRRGPQI